MKKAVFLFLLTAAVCFAAPPADAEARKAAREKAVDAHLQAAAAASKPAQAAGALFKAVRELQELKRFDEAVFHLEKIPRLKGIPRHEAACAFRIAAQCRLEQLRTTEAIAFYERACACRSGKWSECSSCRELGDIFMRLGDSRAALKVFSQAADNPKLGGERFSCLCGKAAALARLKDLDQAKKTLEEAAKLLPPEKRQSAAGLLFYITEGEVMECASDIPRAVEAYRKAVAIPRANWKAVGKARRRLAVLAPAEKGKKK